VRVLKVCLGSNKAGCFLEVAVFIEGSQKGVIRIPEGRGGWGWQRFVDGLRVLVAQLVERALSVALAINAREVGKTQSFTDPAVKGRRGGLCFSFEAASKGIAGICVECGE
jgi:hypothetical protein